MSGTFRSFAPPFIAAAAWLCLGAQAEAEAVQLYDSDPAHPWNRLHRALLVRTSATGREFGHDSVNALLWPNTREHLLTGGSRAEAVAALRSFLEKENASLVREPLLRALLLRDLWAVFDWAAEPGFLFRDASLETPLAELRELLSRAIARTALTREELRALPDIYAAALAEGGFAREFDEAAPDVPFLPAGLFDADSSWVCVGEPPTRQGTPLTQTTPAHLEHFSRSAFFVFLRLPEGRAATKKFLSELTSARSPWSLDGRRVEVSGALPEFPHGTQLALMRCALAIGADGRLAPTRLVESLQLRTIRAPADPKADRSDRVQEFVLTRRPDGARAGLRAIGRDETGFPEFGNLSDPFEERGRDGKTDVPQMRILHSCMGCHHLPGVRSFNTYTRSFGPQLTTPPPLAECAASEREAAAIYWKETRYDWGLLRGMWPRAGQ